MKTLIPILLIVLLASGFRCNRDRVTQSDTFVVEEIPSQCAPEPSQTLGLKSTKGEYFLVDDRTGTFADLVEGDRVKVVYEDSDEVIVCMACTCPDPDGAMIVRELTKL